MLRAWLEGLQRLRAVITLPLPSLNVQCAFPVALLY